MSDFWNNLKTMATQTTSTIKNWTTNSILSNLEKSKLAQYQFKKAITGEVGSKNNPYGLVSPYTLQKKEVTSVNGITGTQYGLIFNVGFSDKIEYALREGASAFMNSLAQAVAEADDAWFFTSSGGSAYLHPRLFSRTDVTFDLKYVSESERTSYIEFTPSGYKNEQIMQIYLKKSNTISQQLATLMQQYGCTIKIDSSKNTFRIILKKDNEKYLKIAEASKDYSKDQEILRQQLDQTIKQHVEMLSTIGNNEEAEKLKKLDTTELPIEGGSFADILKKANIKEQPTNEVKKAVLTSAISTSRKPVTKISVEALPLMSVMRENLSAEDLNKGGNTQDPHFDKRVGNTKDGDIYGMDSKINSPGCIKLYKASVSGGYEDPITVDCFLLQAVQLSLKEKYSVFQSLSGDILAYFFGKQPTMYRYSATLYNTYNQDWYNDFRHYYENNLRGSASISRNVRTVISYENRIVEGFFLEMNAQESATNPNIINIDFTILHIQDTVLNYDAPPVYTGRQGDVVTLDDLKKGVTNIGQELLSQIPSGFSTTLSYMLPGAENALIDLTGSRDTLNSLGDIFKDAVEKTQLKSDIDHNSPEYQSFEKMIEYASGASYRKNAEMLANYKGGKLGKSQFIDLFGPIAKENERQTGIPAAVTMAQAILETGWGSNSMGDAKNLFGIKGKGSAGSVLHWTTEEKNGVKYKIQDYFRKYNTWQESVDDHSKFLLTNQRYSSAVKAYSSGKAFGTPVQQNVDTFARGIHAAGYATDSKYSDKLIAIMRDNNLYKWSA